MQEIARNRCFGGEQLRYTHPATSLSCSMNFSIFLPPQAAKTQVPVLYWLSGLSCTDENFVIKAGAQRAAAARGVALVAADTSPRGADVADDPDAAFDLGLGAGFYLDASQQPWAQHYRMETYISQELPALIDDAFPVDGQRSGVFGHSMGGHGAITLGLKYPDRFRSISAFAPISSPTRCPWGQKALRAYLGPDTETWPRHDSCRLIEHGQASTPLLVDQGDADSFLREQLKPELLQEAARQAGHALDLRMQPGYDHSYFFIASFIDEHIDWHLRQLNA